MQDIMKPMININGTSREDLAEQRINARNAIGKAMQAFGELRPHGRDYQGFPEQYQSDLAIHQNRMKMLNKLYNDLELEAEEILGE